MKLFTVHHAYRVGNSTVTKTITLPSASPAVAERMTRAWLALRGIDPYSVTAQA